MTHPERIVPDATEPGIVALHLKRYEFAREHCAAREVLDAGCGVGYGSAYLADVARRVVGLDRSDDAIAYARERYARPNVEYVVGDLLTLDRGDAEFHVVCAFEVIEHLPEPERFVHEARRVLTHDGVLLVSTPRAAAPNVGPDNPFHTVEFTAHELERLLRRAFSSVALYGQRRLQTRRHRALQRLDVLELRKRVPLVRRAARAVTGTAPMDAVSTHGVVITQDGLDAASELIAVCRP